MGAILEVGEWYYYLRDHLFKMHSPVGPKVPPPKAMLSVLLTFCCQMFAWFSKHCRTLFLFTKSDIKTTLIPVVSV
jgi:hypothetical protein